MGQIDSASDARQRINIRASSEIMGMGIVGAQERIVGPLL